MKNLYINDDKHLEFETEKGRFVMTILNDGNFFLEEKMGGVLAYNDKATKLKNKLKQL